MSSHLDRGRDAYAPTAAAYDLFNAAARPAQLAALQALLPHLKPEAGPILDIGAGSGLNLAEILERVPQAEVFALEPSPAMRSLALGRIAAHPHWHPRVTVRPEDLFSASLPARIGGAVILGVLGHFDPGERAALLAELKARLPAGGVALIDLQAPEKPQRVAPFEFTAATVGELTYRCIGEAWPHEGELMRWRMSYLVLEGERVLDENTTEHLYRHPDPEVIARETEAAGLNLTRISESTFWMLTKS